MVPPDSPRVSRVPGYLGSHGPACLPSPTGLSPSLARLSSRVRVINRFLTGWEATALPPWSHDPIPATPVGLALGWFRLSRVRSPLLAGSRLISLPRGTKMFQFPRFPSACADPHPSRWGRCRIRGSPDQSMLAAPRGISLCAAPFFGSWPQGIHPSLFVA